VGLYVGEALYMYLKEIGDKKYYFYKTTLSRKLFKPTILRDYFLVHEEYVLAYSMIILIRGTHPQAP
jgi:hypothetical protein